MRSMVSSAAVFPTVSYHSDSWTPMAFPLWEFLSCSALAAARFKVRIPQPIATGLRLLCRCLGHNPGASHLRQLQAGYVMFIQALRGRSRRSQPEGSLTQLLD